MPFSVALSVLMIIKIWPSVGYARPYRACSPTAVFYRRYRGLTPAGCGGDANCGQEALESLGYAFRYVAALNHGCYLSLPKAVACECQAESG